MSLRIVPCTLRDANSFVAQHHRHHDQPPGGLFALATANDSGIVGVAIVYAACWRAARALGWRKLVTYTLPEEGGASLRAAGWKCIGEAGGGAWARVDRPTVNRYPTQAKLRWEAA